MTDIPKSPFLQKGINFASVAANEKVKKDQRDVEHLQHDFDDTMKKLKHDIMAFSREETDAAKDIQAKLDASAGTESLLQTGNGEYVQATHQEDSNGALSGWLEGQKVKAKEADEAMHKMKEKLHEDLEVLKR
ncbi:hypothetical protein FOL47_002424, partial [Perkinsus chesapeaki]